MSVFDTYADNPFVIRDAGQEITVSVARTGPTTLRVSWNLPPQILCTSSSGYNGAVLTLDTTPTSLSKLPVDGTIYNADATADPNLNAGDRIGSALVIGAFYNDTTTVMLDVSDAPADKPFYVSLHAVDAQYRYHTDGVHSYSLPFGNGKNDQPTEGFQLIKLGSNGVTLGQSTNLQAGANYTFSVKSDINHNPGYAFNFTGAAAATYGDLLNTLNAQVVASLNPINGTTTPGTGYYWYDASTRQVKLWNGVTNVIQDAVILGEDPLNPSNGRYWFNQTNLQLFKFLTGTGYQQVDYISLAHDPRQPQCDDYWYKNDTSKMYRWNGTIWLETQTFTQVVDPQVAPATSCFSYWYDGKNLYNRDDLGCVWNIVPFVSFAYDFTQPQDGMIWIDTAIETVYEWSNGDWSQKSAFTTKPTAPASGALYLDAINEIVQFWNGTTWITMQSFASTFDPRTPTDGLIWQGVDGSFKMWDTLSTSWVDMQVTDSATDPTLPPVLAQGVVWYDNVAGTFSKLEGTSWIDVTGKTIVGATKPQSLAAFLWFNPTTQAFASLNNGMLTSFVPVLADFNPADVAVGQLWYNQVTSTLSQWDGSVWTPITVYQVPYSVSPGSYFYNTVSGVLSIWNGKVWTVTEAPIKFELTQHGNIKLSSKTLGSQSWVHIVEPNQVWNSLVFGLALKVEHHERGTDPVSTVPSYMQQGVGTDGSQDERRNLVNQLKRLLGYPIVEVELTKEHMDVAIDNALMELRSKSGVGYKRGMFFLDVKPHLQHYILSDATVGFNKVVEVLYLHRMTSAYLGTGVGAGVYGQIAIQQLYSYGKFDLVSYHLVAGYIELMKQLFATEIQFSWDEYTRKLSIYKDFYIHERVLVDAVIEKTEQEILVDRWSAKWIQKYALAQCRLMLAEIRGKYTSVVAAGGQVTMNASDLRATAEREMQECQDDIDNYVVSNKEDWGSSSDFLIG